MADLSSAIQHLLKAKRISALSQSYAKDNPGESTKVFAYLQGGARPTGVSSEMGLGLIEVEDVRRGVVPPPPPPPPPPPDPVGNFDWLGNTYSGQNYNHVPHGANDFAVAPDGVCATAALWIESGHEVKLYTASAAVGPRGLHGTGGSEAVTLSNSYVWAVHGSEIWRWPRASFMANDGLHVARNAGATLRGIAVIGSEVYVSDYGNVRVFPSDLSGGQIRSFSAPNSLHLTADRQGNLWVLRDTTIARYSPTGSLLASWSPSSTFPVDIAADPSADRILVADNGRDQRIKIYDYSGSLIGTFGTQFGYLAGPSPGLLGPLRFCGPRGVGIDAAGNIYVASTGHPGIGPLIWGNDNVYGRFLIVEAYDPGGNRLWKKEGLMFVDVGEPTPDASRFYTRELSFEKDSGGRYQSRSCTLDPWSNPTDGRIVTNTSSIFETTNVRDIGSHRYLTNWGPTSSGMRVLRVSGELAVPAAFLSGNPGNDYIQVEGLARESRPSGFPNNVYTIDMFMDADGNIWRIGEDSKILRFRMQGITAAGNPIYHYADADVWSLPSQLANVRRIEVRDGAVYMVGYAAGTVPPQSEFDQWKWIGSRIVKFPSLPVGGVWPNPVFNAPIHYDPPATSGGSDHPLSFAVSGDKIAVGYQKDPTANSGYLRIYSALNGAELRVVRAYSSSSGPTDFPAAYGEIGWLDIYRSLTFVGNWVWMEDDQLSKQVGVKV